MTLAVGEKALAPVGVTAGGAGEVEHVHVDVLAGIVGVWRLGMN